MDFIDLRSQYEAIKPSVDANMKDVVENAAFIGGEYVSRLEEALADYVGREHCISCGNGTDALQLAYMAYGVGEGDAVFCPNMTFVSSAEPAAMLGATPVFCDIDPYSYNLSPDSLELAIRRVKKEGKLNPKVVVIVDFLGNPAEYDAIASICQDHGLLIIEDAAQGIGGVYRGQRLGGFGDISTTSFFPSKPLGCYGDGGAVFTDDEEIAALVSSIKVHGKGSSKYDNVRIGINSRLDNLQAAVLCAKLPLLDGEMAMRQKIAGVYHAALNDIVQCPAVEEGNVSAFAQYCILLEDNAQRDGLKEHLSQMGIPSLVYYPNCLSRMEGYRGYPSLDTPVAEDYARRNLGIPFSPYLKESDQAKVIDAICDFVAAGR